MHVAPGGEHGSPRADTTGTSDLLPKCVQATCRQLLCPDDFNSLSLAGLFGPIMNKTGVPPHLRSVAASMPDAAPRFMTHDVVSTSSSTYSNFRKTTVSLGVVPSEMNSSEYACRYQPPGTPYRRQTNNGARGSPMTVHGRSSLTMCSGSSRAFTGKDA